MPFAGSVERRGQAGGAAPDDDRGRRSALRAVIWRPSLPASSGVGRFSSAQPSSNTSVGMICLPSLTLLDGASPSGRDRYRRRSYCDTLLAEEFLARLQSLHHTVPYMTIGCVLTIWMHLVVGAAEALATRPQCAGQAHLGDGFGAVAFERHGEHVRVAGAKPQQLGVEGGQALPGLATLGGIEQIVERRSNRSWGIRPVRAEDDRVRVVENIGHIRQAPKARWAVPARSSTRIGRLESKIRLNSASVGEFALEAVVVREVLAWAALRGHRQRLIAPRARRIGSGEHPWMAPPSRSMVR